MIFNLFYATDPFLYPQKTSENLRFFLNQVTTVYSNFCFAKGYWYCRGISDIASLVLYQYFCNNMNVSVWFILLSDSSCVFDSSGVGFKVYYNFSILPNWFLQAVYLTHFLRLAAFSTPRKHEGTSGFLIFSGV